jgi:8-oxo-dGTP pyrophosphatase MutT (NUDIX family)
MTDELTGDAPWQVLDKRRVYASAWINVEQWAVRLPDGSVIPDYTVLDYALPAVGIIAVGDDGRVLLIDHYRFITGTRGWEVPAGRMEEGESVEATGARELLEETGHVASRWEVMGQYHPSNGSSNQVFHLMVARGLTRRSEPLDRNETLDLRWLTAAEVRGLIRDNAIRDGLTLTALSWAFLAGVLG